MPREIKTTLAVDGEAAFKRAISDANTSIRNMGTQLTLATAQFKKDGDAMKLMESRSKTLKAEIDQQNEIVKALEKAVADSTKAYGENSEKTEKWQAELNRAKARLVNLQSELTLNNAGLDRNGRAFDDSSEKAADYQATLQTVGKGVSFENITSGISSITSGFESAVKKVLSFARTMRDTMVDAGHWADDLMTDATKYNMDVEELQRWRNAADFIDTDVETIISARDRLGRKMSEGWTKDKQDMWGLLGIDLYDETGKMRDQMDVMFEVGETLRSMVEIDGNDVRANELAMELFGKGYRDLLPLFRAGREEWERTVADQRVVSKENVEALGAMDDANNNLENSWETLKYSVLAQIAPVMTDAADALSRLLNEFNDWMETEEGKEAMQGLAEALRELFSGLGDIKFKDAIETAKNALKELKNALEWIKEHKSDVGNALKIIAGGFAALKAGELAINIGRIVSGFQVLWAGANKPIPVLPGTSPGTTPTTAPVGGAGAGGGGGVGFLASGGLGGLATIAGLAGLGYLGASELGKWKAANPEKVLGTTENRAARIGGNGDALTEYVLAQAAMEKLDYTASADTVKAAQERIDRAWARLEEAQGGMDALRAYNDWRSVNGIGLTDWRLTPEMMAAAGENRTAAEDGYKEEGKAFEYLQEALGVGFRDFLDALIEKSNSTDMSKMEDLPDSITDAIGRDSGMLDEAVREMRDNTDSGKAVADKVAGADFKRFNGLPMEMQAAVQRGAASGVSGIIVRLDGAAVGRLIAPYVNTYLGSSIG